MATCMQKPLSTSWLWPSWHGRRLLTECGETMKALLDSLFPYCVLSRVRSRERVDLIKVCTRWKDLRIWAVIQLWTAKSEPFDQPSPQQLHCIHASLASSDGLLMVERHVEFARAGRQETFTLQHAKIDRYIVQVVGVPRRDLTKSLPSTFPWLLASFRFDVDQDLKKARPNSGFPFGRLGQESSVDEGNTDEESIASDRYTLLLQDR